MTTVELIPINDCITTSQLSNSTSCINNDSNKEKSVMVDVIIVGVELVVWSLICTYIDLNLQPYCVKLLYELGVHVARKALFYSLNGQLIYQEPRGVEAGYKWSSCLMHRGCSLWRGLDLYRGVTPVDKLYLDERTMIFMGNPNMQASPVIPDWNNFGPMILNEFPITDRVILLGDVTHS
ncbi:hypothetical protein I4U23_010775 [Adineta vaga]|nr:hypothetical protein I4U23_010775 [Adineta vaga]